MPLLIHQPSYSMLNRWVEGGLLDTLGELGAGCIAFSPLAQGMLTQQVPRRRAGAMRARPRAGRSASSCSPRRTSTASAALDAIAKRRGQTLAQMAIAWVLRDPRVTSALIGARTVAAARRFARRGAAAGVSRRRSCAEIDRYAAPVGGDVWG